MKKAEERQLVYGDYVLCVCGSRCMNDYAVFSHALHKFINTQMTEHEKDNLVILSGCAVGPDSMAEFYAKQHNIDYSLMPAEWDKYGKSAGIQRNVSMANVCDILVAFWDGESKGTKHMIDFTKKLGKKVFIFKKVVDKQN